MEFRIGLKSRTDSKKNIQNRCVLENNVVKDGTIIFHLPFQKFHGAQKKRLNFSNDIEIKATNGKTFQNNSLAGKILIYPRTDNDLKNHFYSTLRKSLRRLNKSLG